MFAQTNRVKNFHEFVPIIRFAMGYLNAGENYIQKYESNNAATATKKKQDRIKLPKY